jgi:GntR family transcriptional regulator
LYHQLVTILTDKIHANEYRAGESLPPEKEMEALYGVSRVTVRKAMDELVRMGLVIRQQGRGTFVADKMEDRRSELLRGFVEDRIQQGAEITVRLLEEGLVSATSALSQVLNVDVGSPLCHIRRVGVSDEIPLALSDFWYPIGNGSSPCDVPELGANAAIFTALNKYMKDHEGKTLVGGTKTLEATVCTADEAALLETIRGAPLLLVKVVLSDHTGRPAVFIKARYRGDRYAYSVQLHA